MRGEAKPTYTEQRHAWLRQLRLRGEVDPKGTEWAKAAYSCRILGWTVWVNDELRLERLTDDGIAILDRWDRGEVKVARTLTLKPRGRPLGSKPGRGAPFESRIGYALKAGGLQALADWLVATKQVGDLVTMLGSRVAMYHSGGPVGAVGVMPNEVAAMLSGCVPKYTVPGVLGLPPEHVPRVLDKDEELPAWQRPCPIKFDIAPPVMHEGAPTECDDNVPQDCELVREIEAQAVRAPQFGIRTHLRPSMGTAVGGYTQCESCSGRGSNRHGFQCHTCKGAGRLKRTVEL